MADWAQGDLAECIDDEWYHSGGGRMPADQAPRVGQSFLVTDVGGVQCGETFIATLHFPDFPAFMWEAVRFKKIHPKGEDRMVPRKEAVPA